MLPLTNKVPALVNLVDIVATAYPNTVSILFVDELKTV
jgi:hypothetical protein